MKKRLPAGRARRRGFTMLELMIVIGIAALMMTTAVPFIGGLMNERPLVQTTNDIIDVLSHARAQAILHGRPTAVRINPLERTFRASADGAGGSTEDREAMQFISNDTTSSSSGIPGLSSATIHEDVVVELMDVNFIDVRQEPAAEVHFYPNGTCDMFAIVLRNNNDQWRMIQLDMITGIAEFETDPQKFEQR